jgi:steroid delta-isomerase-like uncharacterized protein
MSVDSTRATMMKYIESEHVDASTFAEDVVFTVMGTGPEAKGPEDVLQMLHYFYNVAFDATFDVKNMIFADGQAALEYDFTGRHIGEFAGVPATGKTVHVPLAVIYNLENDRIRHARIYFEVPAFLQQVGAMG